VAGGGEDGAAVDPLATRLPDSPADPQ
jgi:hypothetical protein